MRFDEVEDRRCRLNQASQSFLGIDVLPSTSLPLRGDHLSELAFLRLVSWLWSIYFETGRANCEALAEVAPAELVDDFAHMHRVRTLRTYTQHNLQPADADDADKMLAAETWFRAHTDGLNDAEDGYWASAIAELQRDASLFLVALEECVSRSAQSELADEIRQQILARVERTIPAFIVDRLIVELRSQYGLDYLDPKAFRELYYSRWRERLRVARQDVDVLDYLRSLIEQAMATHVEREPAPLSGDEIMNAFGIPPGRDVRELKLLAEREAAQGLRSKAELLERLSQLSGRPVVAPWA